MPPTELPGGKRRALLVAHGTYTDSRFGQLRAPTCDVEGFKAVLADPAIGNFDVECVVVQTTPEVKRAPRATSRCPHTTPPALATALVAATAA
jgi:hypothetical protein